MFVVQLPVMARDFARFDELRQEWAVQGGRYIVYVERNGADTDVSMSIDLNRETFEP